MQICASLSIQKILQAQLQHVHGDSLSTDWFNRVTNTRQWQQIKGCAGGSNPSWGAFQMKPPRGKQEIQTDFTWNAPEVPLLLSAQWYYHSKYEHTTWQPVIWLVLKTPSQAVLNHFGPNMQIPETSVNENNPNGWRATYAEHKPLLLQFKWTWKVCVLVCMCCT